MKKIEAKATELVEKINNQIIAGDKSLTLSDTQKEQIKKIHTERIVGLRKLGKEASKEDKKAFNKKYYQKIYKEILSKKQLKARRKGKQKN
ncbi:hypothetical protein [Polaribacter septentrionalilitoris]|uniref:hypothetical protein n=1 Tax=Polaribacter septentrionalilitoris TaxID=2494657 RepID=UPI00135CE6E8|nr:hypothetical protein [Polaribacter septentrionalilitoris]